MKTVDRPAGQQVGEDEDLLGSVFVSKRKHGYSS
jgi:hypothetical protein